MFRISNIIPHTCAYKSKLYELRSHKVVPVMSSKFDLIQIKQGAKLPFFVVSRVLESLKSCNKNLNFCQLECFKISILKVID